MKIAVISHIHYPIKQPYAGGLEAHTDLLVRQLTKLGHTVTLYAKAGSKTNGKVVAIFNGDAKGGKNVFLKLAYRYAARHIAARNYDLIFNNSLDAYPLEWHTATMPPMITVFHTPPFWEMSDVIERQRPQLNRRYIAVSDLTAGQWQKFVTEKIEVVPNGIDMDLWKPHTKAPESVSAFWVGRITPEKGTHIAIEAAQIAGIPLALCGKIYDKKYYRTKIKPLLKTGTAKYAGHLSQSEVNQRFQNASVALVTPMWDEPFGLTSVEALASGVPVAALNHGTTASILKDEYGVLAKSDEAKDLADAMKEALTIDRQKCADYAHKTFALETMVRHYLSLIPQAAFKEEPASLRTYA